MNNQEKLQTAIKNAKWGDDKARVYWGWNGRHQSQGWQYEQPATRLDEWLGANMADAMTTIEGRYFNFTNWNIK